MSELDDRIATTWPWPLTAADAEATRLADLRAVKAEIERLAGVVDVQADITGQLGASFHALAARVAALEAISAPFRSMTASSEDLSSPPAPLVERMLAAWTYARGNAGDGMRAALRVAAEELLGPITPYEWKTAAFDADAVLRARLARAKEAAK